MTLFRLLVLCTFCSFFCESHYLSQTEVEEPKIIIITTTTQKPSSADDEYYYYSDDELDTVQPPFCRDVEFECQSNHHCIPIESFCNGKIDCSDKSDELMCAEGPDIILSDNNNNNNSTAAESKTHSNSTIDSYIILILLIIIVLITIPFEKCKNAEFLYKIIRK